MKRKIYVASSWRYEFYPEALHLNEHEAARWLAKDELDSVRWLPADLQVIKMLKNMQFDMAK